MTTPTSATSQAPSYKTNVNRAKTKRWVEAKSYSYDGDDWGEVDDYDEYPGYEEPVQPSQPAKPTGLRTQGQTIHSNTDVNSNREVFQSPMSVEGPSFPQQGPTQPQPNARHSATNPAENLSFGRGGSPRRADLQQNESFNSAHQGIGPQVTDPSMSAPYQHPPRSQGPVHQPPQPNTESSSRPRRPSQPGLIVANAPHDPHQPQTGRSNDWRSHYSNPGTTASPNRRDFAPSSIPQSHGPNDSSPQREGPAPPRKSSLGQHGQPNLPFDSSLPPHAPAFQPRERKGSSASTSSTPFIRPAEIYKRIEEEREKERQSQESKRPNLETVLGSPPVSQTAQPSIRTEPEGPRLTKEVVHEPMTDFYNDNSDSLPERPSSQQEDVDATREKRRTTSKTFELPKTTKSAASTLSPGLMLPDPTRMSGFGLGFGDSFMNETDSTSRLQAHRLSGSGEPSGGADSSREVSSGDSDLRHRPSKGFTSAVHQAFDTAQDQIPPTPSSTADSSIGRSTSGGTNAVSPIMSRGPSAVERDRVQGLPSIDDVTTPTQDENVPGSHTRPRGSGSFATVTPGTGQNVESEAFNEPPPPGFKVGHRRSSGTPSPDNSPAKTPMLASMSHLRRPQEVDFAEATPTPTESAPSVSESLQESERSSSPERPLTSARTNTSRSGRVKGLAEKFEGTPRPESAASNTTPRASMMAPSPSETSAHGSSRPANDRLESFRPALPGGWQSTTSLEPTSLPNNHFEGTEPARVPGSPTSTPSTAERGTSSREAATIAEKDDPSRTAFQAAKEAGSALAGSLVAATGMSQETDSKAKPAVQSFPDADPKDPSTRYEDFDGFDDESKLRADNGHHPEQPWRKDGASAGHSTKQPSSLPPLQTNASTGEYESDRLRREIVRELSPGMRSNPTTANSDSPYQPSSRYTTNDSVRSNGGLPSEYDSYWNDGSEDGASVHSETGLDSGKDTAQQVPKPAPLAPQSATGSKQRLPLVTESDDMSLSKEDPPNLARRFSWEAPLVELKQPKSTTKPEQSSRTLRPDDTADSQKHLPFAPMTTSMSNLQSTTDPRNEPQVDERHRSRGEAQAPVQLPTGSPNDQNRERRGSFEYADGLEAVPGRATDGNLGTKSVVEHRPESPQMLRSATGERPVETGAGTAESQSLHSRPQVAPAPPSSMPKLPPFRELMSLKSPQERISAFGNVQREFASMNTGLEHWLATTFNALPEHQDILQNGGTYVKGAKPLPPGSRAQGQPYYQQYLDASNHSPSTTSAPASASGPNAQGLSPSGTGGKISTQQVQAKGKEFLRSAGVVSGKANVAAKGLFSKGRSKLRDASSSKKASPYSTPATHAPEGRSEQPRARPQAVPRNKQSLQPNGEASEREVPSEQSTHSQLADDERSVASNTEKSDRLPRSSKIFRKRDNSEKRKSKPRELFEAFKNEINASRTGSRPESSPKSGEQSRPPDDESVGKLNRSEGVDTALDTESVPAASPHRGDQLDSIGRSAATGSSQPAKHASYGSSTPTSGRLPIQLQDGKEDLEEPRASRSPSSVHSHRRPDSEGPAKSDLRKTSQPGPSAALDILPVPQHVEQQDENALQPASHQSITELSPDARRSSSDRPKDSSSVSQEVPVPLAMPARGRHEAPVHYGLEHNFMPEGDFETQKRRSQSFSRPFRQSESRSRSRGSQAQRTPTHRPSLEEPFMPADFYPTSISREEAFMPRSQASEYAIEGIGPPDLPQKESRAQSRRGSRSSAFFKSVTRTFTDSESPVQQPCSERADGSPAASSSNLDGKSKRSSIFGLTLRKSRTEMAVEKDLPQRPVLSREASSLTQLPAPAPPAKNGTTEEDDEFPMRPKQRQRTTSNISKKFQRSATSATKEQDPAKKKRFSAIGSLFSKANAKRRASETYPEPAHTSFTGEPGVQQDRPIHEGSQPALEYYTPRPELDNERVDSYYAPRPNNHQNITSASSAVANPRAASGSLAHVSSDRPAYVQDATARSPGSPNAASKHSSVDFFRKFSHGAKRDDQDAVTSDKSKYPSWNRFSRQKLLPKQEPSRSPGAKQSDSLENGSMPLANPPPLHTGSQAADRTTSPPPPPPPPKDEWHVTSPRRSSLAANTHSKATPLVESPTNMTPLEQRPFQGLPPLQTDVAMSPIKSGMTSPATGSSGKRGITFEEKRRSRQWELERGHMGPIGSEGLPSASPQEHPPTKRLSPAEKRRSRQIEIETGHLASAASGPGSQRGIGGLGQIGQSGRREEEEPVRMAATSFPGEEWAPDHQYTWQDQ